MIVEAENLSYILQVGVFHHQVPLGIVFNKVEICDGDFDPPVLFIALLHMPMHSYGAHVR